MRPRAGEVLHFSEDPTLTRFVPHVAATAQQPEAYVWAVNADHAPSYWFPRQCPRAMAWVGQRTIDDDRERILGPGGGVRMHAIEYGWLPTLQQTTLWAYRFDASQFRPFAPDAHHAYVSTEEVDPLGPPEPVADLLGLHEEAGIQLRVLPSLWDLWDAITASTMSFSGIRLRNARPRQP